MCGNDFRQPAKMPLRIGRRPLRISIAGTTVGLCERVFFQRIVDQIVEFAVTEIAGADDLVRCIPGPNHPGAA
ncbi:MAG: hypothetical protein H6Q04_1443, partial [Acidobacteria bacterium]|nr:hypothetical protein [Acidobacteriota bacterium]